MQHPGPRHALLAVVCIALALALRAASSYEKTSPVRLPGAGGIADELPPPPRTERPSLERFAEIIERPLFEPSRRPLAVGRRPAEVEGLPDVRLVGVVFGGKVAVALLRTGDERTLMRLPMGKTIGGWTLAEVGPRHVVLRREDALHEVKMEDGTWAKGRAVQVSRQSPFRPAR